MSKKIYFVRHGESEANASGLMAGTYDTSLTEQGKQQAKKAGQDLTGKGIELVICSPLTRTRQTAIIIAKEIGYDPAKIIESKLFIERMYGPYEGRPCQEYVAHTEAGKLEAGVETVKDMHARILEGFEWLKTLEADTILIASHGATGRMAKLVSQKLKHSHYHTIDRMANCEIFSFEL
jgi:broad specificity phosphatase PhoE